MCIETALESTVSPRLVVLRGDRGAMLYRVFITGRWDEDEAVGRRYGTAGQKASNTVIALGDALLRSSAASFVARFVRLLGFNSKVGFVISLNLG